MGLNVWRIRLRSIRIGPELTMQEPAFRVRSESVERLRRQADADPECVDEACEAVENLLGCGRVLAQASISGVVAAIQHLHEPLPPRC